MPHHPYLPLPSQAAARELDRESRAWARLIRLLPSGGHEQLLPLQAEVERRYSLHRQRAEAGIVLTLPLADAVESVARDLVAGLL